MDFYNAMMDYSMMFKYMQPPYTRSVQSFFEAKWTQRKELSNDKVREAIYDGLPEAYRKHIETCTTRTIWI